MRKEEEVQYFSCGRKERKKIVCDEDEKVKRLRISATEKRMIHEAAKRWKKRGEAEEEEQRVVSQKHHDKLLSSFRLFRGANRDEKHARNAQSCIGNISLFLFPFDASKSRIP